MTKPLGRMFSPQYERLFRRTMETCPGWRIHCTAADGFPVIKMKAINSSGAELSISSMIRCEWIEQAQRPGEFFAAVADSLNKLAGKRDLELREQRSRVLERMTVEAMLIVWLESDDHPPSKIRRGRPKVRRPS